MKTLNLPEACGMVTTILTFSKTVSYIFKNKLVPVFTDVKEDICYF